MPDPIYAHKNLSAAVQKLATGRGRIKERLNDAAIELVMVDKEVFSMPDVYVEAPAYWNKIWNGLHAAATGDPEQRGIIPASIERMTEEEAAQVAQLIVSLDAMLGSYLSNR